MQLNNYLTISQEYAILSPWKHLLLSRVHQRKPSPHPHSSRRSDYGESRYPTASGSHPCVSIPPKMVSPAIGTSSTSALAPLEERVS